MNGLVAAVQSLEASTIPKSWAEDTGQAKQRNSWCSGADNSRTCQQVTQRLTQMHILKDAPKCSPSSQLPCCIKLNKKNKGEIAPLQSYQKAKIFL
jgi:hypothetical protein